MTTTAPGRSTADQRVTPSTPLTGTAAPSAAPRARRVIRGSRASDNFAIAGSAAGAVALTWLVFTQFAPFSGVVGWLVVGYLAFVGLYALVVSLDEDAQTVRDRVAAVVIQTLAGLLLLVLVFVIGYILVRGAGAMANLNFYVQDLSSTGPLAPLSAGGVLHGAVGTLIEITMALIITVPLGLMCAVFLSEFPGPFARVVRTVVEAMTALPSIVAGLFIYTTYILTFGFEKSGFAASLALSVMMFPIIIRAADVVLRLVPGSLTEASLALGASRWRTVWHVTLPTARSGLATAVILGTARGIGETSPVLLTAGYGGALNLNPTSGPMVSLPLLAYQLRRSPQEAMISRSFGAAALLMAIVLLLFLLARWLGGRGPGVLTARQQLRRDEQSRQDAERLADRAERRAALSRAQPQLAGAPPPTQVSRLLGMVNDASRTEPPQTGASS